MHKGTGLRTYAGAAAIVTGGASGIGRALSIELARRGGAVIIADKQGDLAAATAAAIQASGGMAEAYTLDVRDAAAVEAIVQSVFRSHGRLDYLFNNAGIGVGGETHLHTVETWDRIIDINLKGVVYGVQAAYPIMREQGFGHIVNTASLAGLVAMPGMAAYTATKHAVVGLSKSLRIEAAAAGVRVSALCPGVIRTPILKGGGVLGVMHGVSQSSVDKLMNLLRPMDPAAFARQVLDDVARNRAIITVPRWWRLFWWQHRFMPTAVQSAIDRRIFAFIQSRRGNW